MTDKKTIERFAKLFAGRTDASGRCKIETNGDKTCWCEKKPVTEEVLNDHLTGKNSYGLYMVDDDFQTWVLIIDIDEDKEISQFATPESRLESARKVYQSAVHHELKPYIEISPRGFYHVWLFFNEPIACDIAKGVGRGIVAMAGLPDTTEVFPKQARRGTPYGNFINLPYFGVEECLKTKRRVIVDYETLEPIPLETFLDTVERTESGKIGMAAVRLNIQQARANTNTRKRKRTEQQGDRSKKEPLPFLPCMKKVMEEGIPQGYRDNVMYKMAVQFKVRGYTVEESITHLKELNKNNRPPLEDYVVELKARSAYNSDDTDFGCDTDFMQHFCCKSTECPVWRNANAIVYDGLYEGTHNYIRGVGKHQVEITNFRLEPTRFIQLEHEAFYICDIVTEHKKIQNAVFSKLDLAGKSTFIKALKPYHGLPFTGVDTDVQRIIGILEQYDNIETRYGTKTLGLNEFKNSWVWVTDDVYVTPDGISEREVEYLDNGSRISSKIHYPIKDNIEEVKQALRENLFSINQAFKIANIAGWFFASAFAPMIRKKLSHFPLLHVWGTRGSGKTETLKLMWRLFGVNPPVFSCDATEFILLQLLSATSSIPIIVDEYKSDLNRRKMDALHRYCRMAYDGSTHARGRPDQTSIEYHLQAPVVLSGEMQPNDRALMDRFVVINLTPMDINPQHEKGLARFQAFKKLSTMNLEAFALDYIKYVLNVLYKDFDKVFDSTLDLVLSEIDYNKITSNRYFDTLRVIVFGLLVMRDYLSLDLTDKQILQLLITEQEDTVDSRLMLEFDFMLEDLSVLAHQGLIIEDVHYVVREKLLWLHFNSCYQFWLAYQNRLPGQRVLLNKNSYLKQASEINELGGYVKIVSKQIGMTHKDTGFRNCRCMGIDWKNTRLDLSGFKGIEDDVKPDETNTEFNEGEIA